MSNGVGFFAINDKGEDVDATDTHELLRCGKCGRKYRLDGSPA